MELRTKKVTKEKEIENSL